MLASDISKGLILLVHNEPHRVVDFQIFKPKKGLPFTRVKLRNLANFSNLERSFKLTDPLELAAVVEAPYQYLYPEGADFVFADQATGEQVTILRESMGEDSLWLTHGLIVSVMFFQNRPVAVTFPAHVVLQVVSSESGVKGDSASGATKPATLSTGVVINIPVFVQEGEWVKVDTREGTYLERVAR